jgi:hypothetical protein
MDAQYIEMSPPNGGLICGKGVGYKGVEFVRDQRGLGKDDGVIVRAAEQGSEGLCPERIGR